ncbi:unnamed protein product [Prorocentrum cordatum]|uniref:RRM domain-containing protein n=1 Tax=Prorocentrum cordatum TaxID=2364126 RepID=A0ABN9W9G2_9DINO|nr:unnamed protein product [Polarella glacialis]
MAKRKGAAAPKAKAKAKSAKKARAPREEDDDLSDGWEDAGSAAEAEDDEDSAGSDEVSVLGGSKFGRVVSGQAEHGNSNSSQVFVGGLPWSATEEQLRKFFAKYGEIAEVSLPAKTAYVKFKKQEAARAAIESDGTAFGDNTLKVNQRVSKGLGKGERKAEKVDFRGKRKAKGKGKGKAKKTKKDRAGKSPD